MLLFFMTFRSVRSLFGLREKERIDKSVLLFLSNMSVLLGFKPKNEFLKTQSTQLHRYFYDRQINSFIYHLKPMEIDGPVFLL